MRKSLQSSTSTVTIVPNGLFYNETSSKRTTFVRFKMVGCVDEHTILKRITLLDSYGKTILSIPKSDCQEYAMLYADILEAWTAFWSK